VGWGLNFKTINRKEPKVSAKFTKISKSAFYLCGLCCFFVAFAVKNPFLKSSFTLEMMCCFIAEQNL